MAAFLDWGGYRPRMAVMSFSFSGVNLKGMEGLLVGVSRCWGRSQSTSSLGCKHQLGVGPRTYDS